MTPQPPPKTKQQHPIPRRPYGTTLPPHRHLPPTLPILGLGCSSFSHFFSPSPSSTTTSNPDDLSWVTPTNPTISSWITTILHAISHHDINLLDTAPWYGHGSSELVIGFAVDRFSEYGIRRDDVVINTKLGRYSSHPDRMFDYSATMVTRSVATSLARMKCGYVDVLQLHDPEFAPSVELLLDVTIPAMERLRREGVVMALGVTGYPLEVQREILARSKGESNIEFDQSLTYCRYNLHDRSLVGVGLPRRVAADDDDDDDDDDATRRSSSFASFCKCETVGLMTAAPLSMGLLTADGPPSWHPAGDALKEACRKAAALCESRRVDVARLAIAFALSNPDIPCTILGMKSVDEVDRAAAVAGLFRDRKEGEKQMDVLRRVLGREEMEVLEVLLDEEGGLFADVLRSGEFRWDGVREAEMFWEGVEGGKGEAEKRMRNS